ncbi:MAG: right-handed parallel beta-helix repeat-containing protein, partial [Phycisphaerales bacterium]
MMRAMNLQLVRMIAAGICVLCAAPRVPAGIIYVDAAATGANNGQTWTDAYRHLRDALAAAGQGDEIRVAQGIYRPDLGAGISPGDRTQSFQLKNAVAIKGGYGGLLASNPDERRIEEYQTVLSGDLNGDDGADFANNGDNSYHVVMAEGTSPMTVLEGLSISGGNANGTSGRWDKGGGIYCYLASPAIRQCAFKGNWARQFAGGMYLDYICAGQVSECRFSGNKAASGGALTTGHWCNPHFRDCTFEDNRADNGGAVFNRESSTPTFTDCEFRNNSAAADGGGVKNYGSSAIYNGCMFSRNKAYEGGGMYSIGSYTPGYQPPQLMNCTFVRNSGSYNGGAMFNNIIKPVVSGCVFRSNSAGFGGAIHNWKSSPSVENCTFTGNFAALHGGALDATNNSSPTVTNCTFSLNCGNRGGGAVFCLTSSAVQVSNCILWGNLAPEGAQVYVGASQESASISISHSDVEGGSAAVHVGSGCELIWGDGNIDVAPLLTADGHLSKSSPCIDGGTLSGAPGVDRDGDGRPYGTAVDIGADEFIDTDEDGLPDYWEQDHFGGPGAAIAAIDSDGDGLSNADEYERYGSDPNAGPYYVDASAGDDDYDGRAQTPQGNGAGPKKTIAAAVDAAGSGDTILAAAGSYTGEGNRGIDFGGKAVILRAAGAATIDCGSSDRGFYFHYGETRQTAVIGFTITSGLADRGGAIRCERAHP